MKFLEGLFRRKGQGKEFSEIEKAALDRLHQQAQTGTPTARKEGREKYCHLYEKLIGNNKAPGEEIYRDIYQQHRKQASEMEKDQQT